MNGNKSTKFVEAAKGTNLFFAIYQKIVVNEETREEKRVRSYATIPLNVAIERQKKGLPSAPETNEDGGTLLFVLSPNDLVYLPTENNLKNESISISFDKNRVYKFVSCTGNVGHFIPSYVANPIIQTIELGSNNKAQRAWSNEMIKETCILLKVDRLGNIIELKGNKL